MRSAKLTKNCSRNGLFAQKIQYLYILYSAFRVELFKKPIYLRRLRQKIDAGPIILNDHTNLWTICEVGIPPLLMFLHCGFSISPILRRPLSASRRSSSFNISKFLLCFNFHSSEQLVKGVIGKILELTISKILSIVCYLELFKVQDDIVSNWTGSTVFSDRPPMLILPLKVIFASHLHLK